MFNEQRLVVLCDVETQQDKDTGDRKKVVVNSTTIIAKKTLAGVQTQQLGQLQNMSFQYSVEIDRMYYNEQKYLYMDNKVYEIKTLTPARLPKDCKLNVIAIADKDIEKAIQEFAKWFTIKNLYKCYGIY